nr:hypothetical protein [Tanacetum cinerariifolium]
MANTTPLVTTVTKPAINPVEANSTPRVNIQEFCEENYEDILPIIMDKVRHDRRKDVYTRLDFGEGPRERIKEDSYYSTQGLEPQNQDGDSSWGRSRTRPLSASRDGRHKDRECLRSTRESYGDSFPHSYRDESHHYHMERKRDKSLQSSQKKYIKDLVEIHNIKQRDGETIEDFMERFKIETGQLTKRLNEHVPKTMEEMMITTTAFIRGEAIAASKKKGHVSWKPHDQSKRHSSGKRSDFQSHPRKGRGPNRFNPLTRTPKEILATEASKFQPPPPMVTPVEKGAATSSVTSTTIKVIAQTNA